MEVMVGTLVQIGNMDYKHPMSATTSSTDYDYLVLKSSHSQDFDKTYSKLVVKATDIQIHPGF